MREGQQEHVIDNAVRLAWQASEVAAMQVHTWVSERYGLHQDRHRSVKAEA